MPPTEQFDELERRLSELVKETVQKVKDEFKEKLNTTREQVEDLVGRELSSAREAAAEAQAEATKTAEAVAAAEFRANEANEALAATESRLAETEDALETASTRAAQANEELEAVQNRLAEAHEAHSAAEARAQELSEALEAAEARISELSEALNSAQAEAAEAATTAPGQDLLARLLENHRDIDRGRTQAEVLQSLLNGTGDFASRTALFLTTPDGLRGWGQRGFGTGTVEFDELVIDYEVGAGPSRLASGRGVVELSDEDCTAICDRIDGSRPGQGVLVPIVLANRLAAALYADQIDDGTFDISALQLAAYSAALALETLPLREGRATATLHPVTDSAVEADLELWDFTPPAFEPEMADAAPEIEDVEEARDLEPIDLETATETAQEGAEHEPTSEFVDYQPAEASGFDVEEEEEPRLDTTADIIDDYAPATLEPVDEPAQYEAAPAEIEEPTAAAEESIVEEATERAPDEMPTEVAPPPPVSSDGAQVAPPEDLEGPGWAFQTRTLGGDGEDSAHEEARRLARLLVTEIKLYNEEQVEEGRRNRNIYQSLREDIDRSRQIYEERVDEEVRTGTDYFHDELVRILAAGETEVLGV